MRMYLKGFNELEIQAPLNMPDIYSLCKEPFFINADVEEAYKRGTDLTRKLIDNAPLRRNMKYAFMTQIVQLILPGTGTIQHPMWHIDPGTKGAFLDEAYLHILASGENLTCTTRFLKEGVTIDMPDEMVDATPGPVASFLHKHISSQGFEAASVPSNQFVTFTAQHPHIVTSPEKPEIRFFARIQESNTEPPRKWDDAQRKESYVLDINTGRMNATLKKTESGIELIY